MAPWGRGPRVAPLHPGVDTQGSREFGDSPLAVVDLNLDRGDAARLRSGHTGDDDRSGRAVLSETGNVDSRLGLIGACFAHPRSFHDRGRVRWRRMPCAACTVPRIGPVTVLRPVRAR